MNARRGFVLKVFLLASAWSLAACGGTSGGGYGSSTSGGGSASGGVTTRQVSGLGGVLADGSGRTLYVAQQEVAGKIACTGACTTVWIPLLTKSRQPSVAPGLPTLGTVKRPDTGKLQVTYAGSPLYTFKFDPGPGGSKGNGVSDQFGGHSFTWAAATVKGATSAAPTGGSSSGAYGY